MEKNEEEKLSELIKSSDVEIPDDLHEKIMAGIKKEKKSLTFGDKFKKSKKWATALAAVLCLCVVGGVAGSFILHGGNKTTEDNCCVAEDENPAKGISIFYSQSESCPQRGGNVEPQDGDIPDGKYNALTAEAAEAIKTAEKADKTVDEVPKNTAYGESGVTVYYSKTEDSASVRLPEYIGLWEAGGISLSLNVDGKFTYTATDGKITSAVYGKYTVDEEKEQIEFVCGDETALFSYGIGKGGLELTYISGDKIF